MADPHTQQAQRPPWVVRSLRGLILLGLMVLALGLVLGSGEWAARRELQGQTAAIQNRIDLQTQGLRGLVARYKHIPFTTAQYADVAAVLQPGAPPALATRVNRYLQEINRQVEADALYVMNAQGVAVASSNWQEPSSFVGDDFSFRPYFKDAIAGRSGFFYAVGSVTGIPGMFLTTPVLQGGRPIGVVAIKVSLRDTTLAWQRAGGPVSLVDANGIVFLSSVPQWLYHRTRQLTPAQAATIVDHAQYGWHADFDPVPWAVEIGPSQSVLTNTKVQGATRQYLTVTEDLPELGWSLVAMSDIAPVSTARWVASALAALVLAVLLLGTTIWLQRERRFREQRSARHELELRVQERTAELREAHAFRQAMGDSLLVGMRARDLEGRIIYVNPAMCEMVGYSAEELLGRAPPYPYWHPEELAKHWHDSDVVLSGKAALTGFESRIRHRDGRDVYTMVYTAPLIDAQGKHSGWMSSVVDITAQKQAQEQQRLQAAKMQSTGRLASMGEMASTLAHELSQPLMAMVSFAGAARAYAERKDAALLAQTLADIRSQAQRAADIVARIRGFVKQQTPGFQPCTLDAIVANVLGLLGPEIRQQGARVVTRLEPGLPTILADRLLLEQVLLNLVVNALQAMAETPVADKCVTLETGRVGGSGPDAGMVFLRVSDCGPGIAPQVQAQLFEPFFTTKAEGLGLGLNICRTTVEAHRGTLSVANLAQGGAAFSVHLPVSDLPLGAAHHEPAKPQHLPG